MINLNILSQLVGVQFKKGERAGEEYGEGRGLFSACCTVGVMEKLCNAFGAHGVIQCDDTDAYHLSKYSNQQTESLLPDIIKAGSQIRLDADELVLQAISQKRAYPIYNDDSTSNRRNVSKFNFHLDPNLYKLGMAEIFQQVNLHIIDETTNVLSIYDDKEKLMYDMDENLHEII